MQETGNKLTEYVKSKNNLSTSLFKAMYCGHKFTIKNHKAWKKCINEALSEKH